MNREGQLKLNCPDTPSLNDGESPPQVLSQAELDYDELMKKVQRAVDEGLDYEATLYDLDPDCTIRSAFQAEEHQREVEKQNEAARLQEKINHHGADLVRAQLHALQLRNARLSAASLMDDTWGKRTPTEEIAAQEARRRQRGRRA